MHVKTLYDSVPLPGLLSSELRQLYDGDLSFPDLAQSRPFIVGNFVQTLDGIVSFKIPGSSGGADISGRNQEDTFIMGLLRACADAVMIGEETFRVGTGHLWTAEFIYPKLRTEFDAFRGKLGKQSRHPLMVIVSGKGTVDLDAMAFHQHDVNSVVLTTERGRESLRMRYGTALPMAVQVLPGDPLLDAADIADVLHKKYGVRVLLHEGGPALFSSFLREALLDELFLTIAPQIVGRGKSGERPNFSGRLSLGPDEALWGTLLSVKCAPTGHLFLRYQCKSKDSLR